MVSLGLTSRAFVKAKHLATLITVASLVMAGVHIKWPNLKIDAITFGLLAFAVVPWLRSIIKTVQLPGGWKVELQDYSQSTMDEPPPPVHDRDGPCESIEQRLRDFFLYMAQSELKELCLRTPGLAILCYARAWNPSGLLWFAIEMHMLFIFGREERFVGRRAYVPFT